MAARASLAAQLHEARADIARLAELVEVERNNTDLLREEFVESDQLSESVLDLERQLNDPDWMRLIALTAVEFTPTGFQRLRAVCRLMALSSPLIKRGLGLRSAYVFGQGVEITARANGKASRGEQDVQAVVAAFLADDGNQSAVTGPEARDQLERSGLGCDGNVFIAAFTRPVTGEVQVRTIPTDEIAEVISNPEDTSDPWYYRRRWNQPKLDMGTGMVVPEPAERLYPALGHRPARRPKLIGQVQVAWDSPVLHVAVNRPLGWTFGVPDSYAAINWARAYKEFLEQWAVLMKSLSRYAWRLTAKGANRAQAQARIAQAPPRDPLTRQAQDAGATAITPMDATFEAIPKTGATIDAESGRPLAMMVAAALGVPVTMLLSDPGQTGARATAETLDQPTELEMSQRRDLWTGAYRRLIRYVIAESVRAPQGKLKGKITVDRYGRETVTLFGKTDQTVDVVWPDLDDTDTATLVKAVADAAGVGVVPPEVILRLLLTALGVRDVDTLVEAMLGDDGAFQWPAPPGGGAGQDAANLHRAGQDPATAGTGPMAPTQPPDATGGPPGVADQMVERQADVDWGLFSGGQQPADTAPAPTGTPPPGDDNTDNIDMTAFEF